MARRKMISATPTPMLIRPPIFKPSRALILFRRSCSRIIWMAALAPSPDDSASAPHGVGFIKRFALFATVVDPGNQRNKDDEQRDSPDGQEQPYAHISRKICSADQLQCEIGHCFLLWGAFFPLRTVGQGEAESGCNLFGGDRKRRRSQQRVIVLRANRKSDIVVP